jgi:regulatory protein YycH of two-component signal transduction system YycFG
LKFETEELPEMSFDRIIIDWNDLSKDRKLTVLLLNTTNRTMYRTSIENQGESRVLTTFVDPTKSFFIYTEIKRDNLLSLYTAVNPVDAVKYMYYMNEIPIEKFKRVLFQHQDIVQQSDETATTRKYNDNMSFMTVDTKNRILNYVYPASEGLANIVPSKLLNESFDFINEHGGYNADYRLSFINTDKHIVDYQLYYQGLPVFSTETTTKISTTWGDEQVHKYRRPYYVLEMDIPGEMKIKELPSGVEIAEKYIQSQENVKDLVLGYYLVQNPDYSELEPAWFILKENSWERIKLEGIGGMTNGLE